MSWHIHILNFKSISQKTAEKKSGKLNSSKGQILLQKYVKRDESQTWSVLCHDKFIYKILSQYLKRRQRKVWKTEVWLSNGRTDWRTASKLRVPQQAGRGLKILVNCTGIWTRDLPFTKRARYHCATRIDVSRVDKSSPGFTCAIFRNFATSTKFYR